MYQMKHRLIHSPDSPAKSLTILFGCLLCCVCGCGVWPTTQHPTARRAVERITAETAHRIERLGAWKFVAFSPLDAFFARLGNSIIGAGVDGDQRILYVAHGSPTSFGMVAGVYGYSLDTGEQVVECPFPANTDMTGTSRGIAGYSPVVFDFERHACYVTLLLKESGDRVQATVKISLKGDKPRLMAKGYEISSGALLGNRRLLLQSSRHYPFVLSVLNMDTETLEGPYELRPDMRPNMFRCDVAAMSNGYIVAQQWGVKVKDTIRAWGVLYVFRVLPDGLELVKSTDDFWGFGLVTPLLPLPRAEASPWIMVEPGRKQNEDGFYYPPPEVVRVPELEPGNWLTDGDASVEAMKRDSVCIFGAHIPGTNLVYTFVRDEGWVANRRFRIYDSRNGNLLAELRLHAFPVEPEAFYIFFDQEGRYIGFQSDHWVQLFGIPE